MYKIFVSSTSLDLQAYRHATIEVCNRLGLVPVGMEFFGAMGAGATAGSKRQLDDADVYVGIFAHRYGYVEREHSKSVTELEYDYAGERGLERLCFLVDPSYPWPDDAIETDGFEPLRRFKERIEHEQIRVRFTTVDDYRFKLLDTLSKWLLTHRRAGPSLAGAEPPLQLQVFKVVKGTRFHFRAQRVPFFGAQNELAQAEAFLDSDAPFSWWLLLGEAGAGKSRLALELCVRRKKASWRAGFLPRAHDFNTWSYWEPSAPTLIVIDYVHNRANELKAIVSALTGRELPHPVRLLLLERRSEGQWWDEFRGTGTDRMAVESSQHAEPLVVGPMSDDDLWSSIVSLVETSTGRGLPDRDGFLQSLKAIDPLGRPLFAALAADAWAAGRDLGDWDRDALLRDVLQRENESYWKPGGVREKDRNLLAVATLTGGLRVGDLDALAHISRDLPTLSPDDPDRYDARRYAFFVSHDSRELLDPLEPDLIGEFFVLEHLTPEDSGDKARGMKLNVVAWLAHSSGVFAFTSRVLQDFPEHPGLAIVTKSCDVVLSTLDDVSEELRKDLLLHVPATVGNLVHFDCEHLRFDSARARLEQLCGLTDRWPELEVLQSIEISMTVFLVVALLRAKERTGASAVISRLSQRIGGRTALAGLAIRVFGLRAGVLAERGDADLTKVVFGAACSFMKGQEHDESLMAALAEATKEMIHGLVEKECWSAGAEVFFEAAAILGDRLPATSAAPFGLAALDLVLNGIGNSMADFDTHHQEYVQIYNLGRPIVDSQAFKEGLVKRHDPEEDDSSAYVAARTTDAFDAIGTLLEGEGSAGADHSRASRKVRSPKPSRR